MPKHRRMKHMEEPCGASGDYPEFGAIFMSNNSTRKECLERELFGLPMRQAGFVKQVKAGMLLFLFEFESRELHGVFQASSDGAINIESDAFFSSGKQFPAQVKFTEKWRCRPLPESEFRYAILENYFTATKFNFGLSKAQVQKLLKLFSLKKEDISLPRKTAVVPTRKVERNLRNRVGDRGFGNRNAGEAEGDVDSEFPFRVTSAGDARGRKLTENYGFGDESDIGLEVDPTTRKVERNMRNRVGDRGFGNRNAGETDGDVDSELPFRVTSAGDARGRRLTENYGFGDESDIGLEVDPTTRKVERNMRNRVGDRGFGNRNAGETDGDVDSELPFRVTSAGDARGRRLTENYGFGDESDIGLEVDPTTRKVERNMRNRVGDRGFGNRNAGETDGDVDSELPFRVTSAGDARGRRLTENYGFGDESDIGLEVDPTKGNEYSGDTSDVNLYYSLGTDALTNISYNSLVNDRRVPKNLRHTASGWLENEYNEKHGIVQASSWSKDKERFNLEADPVVPPQSIPLDLPYGTNTECYDPCDPGIMGDATMTSSRHDLAASNADFIGSASFPANSNYDLGEEYIPVGGYVSDVLPSETVQPFPDEYNGTSMNTSNLDYIPMPTERREYQTIIGMSGVARVESESRNGHLRHYQFPGNITSAGATENMRTIERLPYPDHRIFPSFTYPSSSRGFSPKDGLNNETQTYQHQEEFGGHVSSYTNKMAVRDSSIYPSFAYPSTSGDGAGLYDKTNIKGQAYQRHEEFGGDAFDSNNRVTRMKERGNPAELGRTGTRESVFKRLGVPSKERFAEKDTSPDTESVDEVMAFLNDCQKVWMEKTRSNMSNPENSGKPKKKKEKIQTAEVLDNDLIYPFTETTPDDLLDCEGSMEQSVQKLPFINFKRRSKAQKSPGDPTQGCKESPETPASQNKKRKLVRPKLIEDNSEKYRGNKDNPIRIVLASEKDGENKDTRLQILASQSASEVPVYDFPGRNEDGSENDRGQNEDHIENILASRSAVEVPVHDFLGHDEDEDSEKDRGNDGDPTDNVLSTQSATEVPFHDFLGRNDR